jgi:prepilin-type N-terminal cleavage/methylation domain-containing protein
MKKTQSKSGFTLIEVLIVISIIGVLSSLTLLGLGTFRASGRDVKRITDLRQITNALELYYAKVGNYPDALTGLLKTANPAGVIDKVPADPTNVAPNVYSYSTCTGGYVVKAVLEEANEKILAESYVGAQGDGCTVSCAAASKEYCIKF